MTGTEKQEPIMTQQWKASVKSNHFVLAMRDYYHDSFAIQLERQKHLQLSTKRTPIRSSTEPAGGFGRITSEPDGEHIQVPYAVIDSSDEWIVPRLRVDSLRCVLDAIDIDTSGFITVREIDMFMQKRPDGWR